MFGYMSSTGIIAQIWSDTIAKGMETDVYGTTHGLVSKRNFRTISRNSSHALNTAA